MAKKKTRRQKRDRPLIANDDYAQAIIKALNQVQRGSGRRPAEIFRDWIQLADASLEALPTQLKYVGRTGSPGPDKPETAELFGRIRRWYEQPAWLSFAKAFGILLDSSAAGLHDRPGAMGPDVLGQVYMSWANSDPSWQAQYFTPWNVALLMASITVGNGEREVHDRIKKALLHPDNLWGQSVLLASLALPADGAGARDYFFSTVLPAALPFYEKIMVNEPAIGSGVLILATAAQYPEWANYWGLISYTGQDLDRSSVWMSRINLKLYGLNSYGLTLHLAAVEAMEAAGRRAPLPGKPVEILHNAGDLTTPTFAELFSWNLAELQPAMPVEAG